MGKRVRTPKPGQPQIRRMWFCIKLLGLGVIFLFISAVVIGIPLPGVWQTVFVPFWFSVAIALPLFIVIFLLRAIYLKAKAKHYETMFKLSTDPRFK